MNNENWLFGFVTVHFDRQGKQKLHESIHFLLYAKTKELLICFTYLLLWVLTIIVRLFFCLVCVFGKLFFSFEFLCLL